VWRELHVIGEITGQRTIMAVITGSAAVLRALVFAQPGNATAARDYPQYMRLSSLNDRKFLPLMLKPLTAASDVRRAMVCVASGVPWQHAAMEAGMLRAPDGYNVDDPPAEALSAGFGAGDDAVARVQAHARGLVGWMPDVMTGVDMRVRPFFAYLRDAEQHRMLLRLYTAWEESVGGTVSAVDEAAGMSPTLCDFKMPLRADDDASEWYQLMDKGVVYFDDELLRGSVAFMHPSDAGSCILAFRDEHAEGVLSAAEQVSLLYPGLSSADEINERLVMESLAWRSREPGGLALVDGRSITGLSARQDHLLVAGADGHTIGSPEHLLRAARNTLHKEYPDMFGGDGIALVAPDHCGDAEAAAPPPDPSEHVLLRAQVKQSAEDATTKINAPDARRWLDKLAEHSATICTQLAPLLGEGATVVPRHVLDRASSIRPGGQGVSRALCTVRDVGQHAGVLVAASSCLCRSASADEVWFSPDCLNVCGGNVGDALTLSHPSFLQRVALHRHVQLARLCSWRWQH